MRSQLLRLLQRVPTGLAAQDGMQAMRMLSTSSNEASSLLSNLQGKQQEKTMFRGFGLPQMQQHGLSFAAPLHTFNKEEEQKTLPQVAVPELPKGLAALPPRRHMASAAAGIHPHAAHPYHILPGSAWPAMAGGSLMTLAMGMSCWFHGLPFGGGILAAGIASTLMTAVSWWRDVIIESDMGMHTEVVKRNLMTGVWIFIVSEAALFFGLLWACVDLGMSPNVNIQMQWPPVGIEPVGWDKRALVMSAVLAASYYSANVAVVAKDPKMVMRALGTTIALGAMFLGDQYIEYNELPFTITDSGYGTTFFLTTGFHGMHVLVGALWLASAMAMYPRFNNVGVGMKGAVLYWHFVDIVWIAVYGIIYVAQL